MQHLVMKPIDKDFPDGGEVIVHRDSGVLFLTKTRSTVQKAATGYEVVFVESIAGWYIVSEVFDARGLKEIHL